MNIDLTPIFKVVLILYVVAALKLKSTTYFFTALESFLKYYFNSLKQYKQSFW